MDDQNQKQPVAETQAESEVASTSEQETKQEAPIKEQEKKEEGEKKTRLEKRIDELQEKLDDAKTPEDKNRISALIERLREKQKKEYFSFPREPLIKPEDIEEGIDPQELERRQAIRELALKEEIKQEIQAQTEIENNIKDHIKDYEETVKAYPELDPKSAEYDKDLADFVTKQYFLANSIYNPLTGKNELLPVVKTSQIVSQIKSLIERERTKAQAEVKGKLTSDLESSAIPPSQQSSLSEEDDTALIEKAKSTGDVEDWARVLKKRFS